MPRKQWSTIKTEKQYWAVKCPNCGRYQCKEQRMYGQEIKRATCIYCEGKIFLANSGQTFSMEEAQQIVRTKNAKLMKDQNVLEFKTFKKRR